MHTYVLITAAHTFVQSLCTHLNLVKPASSAMRIAHEPACIQPTYTKQPLIMLLKSEKNLEEWQIRKTAITPQGNHLHFSQGKH